MRGVDADASEMRRVKTPNKIAMAKLSKFLDRRLTPEQRNALVRPLNGAEQLRFMSMSVLAEVLRYMNSFGMDMEAINQNFTYESILPYIEVLINRHVEAKRGRAPSETDRNIMRLRLAATFARYIKYVAIIRTSAAQLQAQMQYQSQLEGGITAGPSTEI
jgi:hypothetical protein